MLKKICVGVLVGLLVALAAIGAGAQDAEAEVCAPEFLTTPAPDGKSIMDALAEQMDGLEALAAAGDVKGWLKASNMLRLSLGIMEAQCSGMHFSSEGKGLKSLVGPVVLPDGLWKVSLRTDGMITTVNVTNVNGSCNDSIIDNIMMISQGTMDVAQEALLTTSEGCIAMFEVENVGGKAWDLTIEPISLK